MKNVLLFLVAVLLVAVLIPFALTAKVVKAITVTSFDWSWFMRLAVSLDQLGNVIGDDLFNLVLIHKDYLAPFGDEDETVSSVVGKNYLANNLTTSGRLLRNVLHWLDPNHSVNSIEK